MNRNLLLSMTFAGVIIGQGIRHVCLAQDPPEFAVIQESMTESNLGEIEHLAVDVARRTLLAYHPHMSRYPVKTLELRVRPEGDFIHSYVKLQWIGKRGFRKCIYTSEVYSSFVYTAEIRRIYGLRYRDNTLFQRRLCAVTPDVLSAVNQAFVVRDPVQMPAPLVSNRLSIMPPRSKEWRYMILQGDRGWHVYNADDYIDPDWINTEPPYPSE